jgi:hypothetical protein
MARLGKITLFKFLDAIRICRGLSGFLWKVHAFANYNILSCHKKEQNPRNIRDYLKHVNFICKTSINFVEPRCLLAADCSGMQKV